MTDKAQSRKKIYQLAKEINISQETLIQYLTKRGHVVKSHMSTVDDAMMSDIGRYAKKDWEKFEVDLQELKAIHNSHATSESHNPDLSHEQDNPKTLKKTMQYKAEPLAQSPTFKKRLAALKEQFPDKIILFELNGSYAAFEEDAKTLSKALGLFLLENYKWGIIDEGVLTSGFRSKDLYINRFKLWMAGYRVKIL